MIVAYIFPAFNMCLFLKKKKLKRKRNTHHSVTFSSEEDKKIQAIMQQGGDAELVAVQGSLKLSLHEFVADLGKA